MMLYCLSDELLTILDTMEHSAKDVGEHHGKGALQTIQGFEVETPPKCEFHSDRNGIPGSIIADKGVKTDPSKPKAKSKNGKNPRKVQKSPKSLGFCKFYRRFIEGFRRNLETSVRINAQEKQGDKNGNWGEE